MTTPKRKVIYDVVVDLLQDGSTLMAVKELKEYFDGLYLKDAKQIIDAFKESDQSMASFESILSEHINLK